MVGWDLGLAGAAGPGSALLLEPWRGAGAGGAEDLGARRMGRRPGPSGWSGGHRVAGREPESPHARRGSRRGRAGGATGRGSAASVLRGPGWPPGGAAGARSLAPPPR